VAAVPVPNSPFGAAPQPHSEPFTGAVNGWQVRQTNGEHALMRNEQLRYRGEIWDEDGDEGIDKGADAKSAEGVGAESDEAQIGWREGGGGLVLPPGERGYF
jgi:hypothetical protein